MFFPEGTMKKTFSITNLDCEVCASKMEAGISKLEGVNSAKISFVTQKLVLDANDDVFDSIVEKAKEICKKVHRSTELVAR